MKSLKPNQLGPWCSYCIDKTRATYREDGFAGKFSCDHHKTNLQNDETKSRLKDARMTEADYQTWGNL